ncbi:MAG: c-type cytochrome [Cytophagales bacterium]|nr:c-type cytochrome [Cytophagales bacterium]
MRPNIIAITLAFLVPFLFLSCQPEEYQEPKISLEGYQVEEGFNLEVVASEPLLEAPVAMDFDDQGRMWVVQMPGYMENMAGDTEDEPSGSIVILEDLDKDGKVDHSKVFLDDLVLPRAIAHVYGGLLYAEPPNLWFVEIENDLPGKRTLVDSLYATEGNVEHQANGLMMNIDNWIYNSRSHFRYRRINDEWIKEVTSFRGQWGITKDNLGRLYYNDNSTQLAGDYVLPNHHIKNPYWQPKGGIGNKLTDNQRVYPIQATMVNRGYQPGVLDVDSMLVNVTSACGPMVYRGGQFPVAYDQNAFVCVPEVNAVKRNILHFNGPYTKGVQAEIGKEFLVTTDEAFRPVNLFNGPDGAMYILDLHRGIIQHQAYMTTYLRDKIAKRGFDTLLGMGRILKVTHEHSQPLKIPAFDELNTDELILLLEHQNGWIRDRAQHLLIRETDEEVINQVQAYLRSSDNDMGKTHALYVLEANDVIDADQMAQTILRSGPDFVVHALKLMDSMDAALSDEKINALVESLIERKDPSIDLYLISFLARQKQAYNSPLFSLLYDYDTLLYHDGFLSALETADESIDFKSSITSGLFERTVQLVQNQSDDNKHWIHRRAVLPSDNRTVGLKLFREVCAACHGDLGQGSDGLAPPLTNSEYIKGPSRRLAALLLHGMKGPLHVNGQRYEFNAQMPGLLNNPNISDEDLSNLIMYINNAFGESRWESTGEMIKELRSARPSGQPYTEEELLDITE